MTVDENEGVKFSGRIISEREMIERFEEKVRSLESQLAEAKQDKNDVGTQIMDLHKRMTIHKEQLAAKSEECDYWKAAYRNALADGQDKDKHMADMERAFGEDKENG